MPKFKIADSSAVLNAVGEDADWNGWSVPVATEAQVREWADAVNSTEGADLLVSTAEGELRLTDPERDEEQTDVWTAVGTTEDGTVTYALSGWVWEPADRLLDFDSAEAIGLDGTGRDGDVTSTWSALSDARLLYALAVLGSSLDDLDDDAAEVADERYTAANDTAVERWTDEGMGRLAAWCVATKASADDLARLALEETDLLLAVISGEVA